MAPRQAQLRHSRQESRDRIVAAATELVRDRSYNELSIGEVMERAGFGRTIFYRHFDDLGDLLVRASRAAIDQLYASPRPLAEAAAAGGAPPPPAGARPPGPPGSR